MAKTIDIELQKQLDKPQVWFCKYFPARIRNVSEREDVYKRQNTSWMFSRCRKSSYVRSPSLIGLPPSSHFINILIHLCLEITDGHISRCIYAGLEVWMLSLIHIL